MAEPGLESTHDSERETPLLEARGITVERGKRRTLEDVSLELRRGEILALVGPNGAGKSTLLKALLGLIPSEGEVLYSGQSRRSLSPKERARTIAYIPQEGLLTQGFLVEEVVAQGRYSHLEERRRLSPADREAVHAALHAAHAADLIGRRYNALSLGERRRVLLARALASGARVIALDEPDAFLDLGQKLALFELLRALRAQGYAILVVLHGLDEAISLADRALLLANGRAMLSGPPESVLNAEMMREIYGVERRGEPPRFERIGAPITINETPAGAMPRPPRSRSLPLVTLNFAALFFALLLGVSSLIAKGGLSARSSDEKAGAFAESETLIDERGFVFQAGGYERIVSGSVTVDQILAELIDPARVVAVTSYGQNYEPAAHRFASHQTIERLAELERILALKPDLIIVHDLADEAALARLRELGVPVFDLGPVGDAERFARDIRIVGALIGERGRAEALADLYLSRLERISPAEPPDMARPTALYVRSFGRDLLGGARGTHYHDLIHYAGLRDAASEHRGWPRYEPEQILALDPDYLLTAAGKAGSLCARPGLEALRACRQGAVLEVEAALLDDSAFGLERAALALRRAYEESAARRSSGR